VTEAELLVLVSETEEELEVLVTDSELLEEEVLVSLILELVFVTEAEELLLLLLEEPTTFTVISPV